MSYDIGSELHVNHVRTREAFAAGMREARICVVGFRSRRARDKRRKLTYSLCLTVRCEYREEDDQKVSSRFISPSRHKVQLTFLFPSLAHRYAQAMLRYVSHPTMLISATLTLCSTLPSGCVIAADIPTEMEGLSCLPPLPFSLLRLTSISASFLSDELAKFMIRIEPYWSIEVRPSSPHLPLPSSPVYPSPPFPLPQEINAAINTALASPQTLQRKALLGFAYAREHLTNVYKVDRVILGLVDDYEKGQRGYKFPFGFSMRWV